MGSRPYPALAGSCRHQDAAISQIQLRILISVWQHLELAGIDKQLLPISNGIDHGISALNISVAFQYHAMRVVPVMVLVIE